MTADTRTVAASSRVRDTRQGANGADSQPVILADNVTRSFTVGNQQVHALAGVSLSVPTGSFVALMGRSGSGKTTLLNMIGALDQPSTGEVYVEGRPLSKLSDNELTRLRREEYGFVFQSYALLPILSTAENVELPLRIAGKVGAKERRQRVEDALALVGLERWANHRPYEMSGGQQQRVAIARALVSRPRVLIGDEPTGELDSKTGAKIMQLLRDIVDREGVTLIMATHDPTVEQYADEIYRMQDGRIIEHWAREQPGE
ncbi:MAG: ABC transporter ATP-binding protein [Chloroflexota bacterium]|nr:ABC transporter ATP-binding protein [Chloroflexota bacterium]